MRMSGGNTDKHRHWWAGVPGDPKGTFTGDKQCSCGAVKYWNGKKWVIKKPKAT